MSRFLLVALGGALGAMARYGLALGATRLSLTTGWPWATFTVNVSGALLMGLLGGWLSLKAGPNAESLRLFAGVGVLGGFTTFSSFSLETAQMLERREFGTAFGYALGSVLVCVAALFAGLMIARRIWNA